jgi:hypothetical protein
VHDIFKYLIQAHTSFIHPSVKNCRCLALTFGRLWAHPDFSAQGIDLNFEREGDTFGELSNKTVA